MGVSGWQVLAGLDISQKIGLHMALGKSMNIVTQQQCNMNIPIGGICWFGLLRHKQLYEVCALAAKSTYIHVYCVCAYVCACVYVLALNTMRNKFCEEECLADC